MTVVTPRVFYVVSAFFYFHHQYQDLRTSALRDMRATRSTPPNVAGQRINLLFLSPAPGIDPGSAGVRLQCFTHRPRRPQCI